MNAYRSMTTLSFCLLAACTAVKKPEDMPLIAQTPGSSTSVSKSLSPDQPMDKTTSPENNLKSNTLQGHASTGVSSWRISGAIAARNKNKSWTASLNWTQQGSNRYQIRLYGPLGGGTVLVEKQGGVVTYRDGPKKITSSNADKLILAQTGVPLPVSSLYYWVRGIPAPGGQRPSAGSKPLSELHQDGYTIVYSQYTVVNGITLPSKIRLEGHGVLIKLVIKHWSI